MGVETLPDDVLGDIFLTLDRMYHPFPSSRKEPHSLEEKFWLAQVCASWRATALSLPLLWANATLRTPADAACLLIALARSALIPLDVRIRWEEDTPWARGLNPAATHCVVNALLGHSSHLKRLSLEWNVGVPDALGRLLGTGAEFPMLEEIIALGGNPFPCRVDISAPQLRLLSLHYQEYHIWEHLFTSKLRRLEIRTCYPFISAARIQTLIFRGCPNVCDLTLHTGLASDSFRDLASTPLRHVRSLSLRMMNTHEMVDIIRAGFAATIPDLAVETPDFRVSDGMKALIAELLRGITVTGVEFDTDYTLTLSAFGQGALGAARRSFPACLLPSLCWPDLWAELVAHNVGHTLRVLDFTCDKWNVLVPAIATHPLGGQEVELRLQLYSSSFDPEYIPKHGYWEDDDDFVTDEDDEPVYYKCILIPMPLHISNLRRIVFTDLGHYTGPDDEIISRVEYIGKILDVVSSDSKTVEVCVSRAGLEEDQDPVSVQAFVEKYSSGAWTLCDHCSDAVD
ncbi:hypothetical protein EXIGLDRAFT_734857 [Exidia glandulosa HHB12029]|uniref:F-box domain-containing protein n=1 Tax=Exidia glandulosa HHB12029 TaxID=1314781 RepID=A0A165AYQ7_EXIGL|nr:hypothetical protein EXIGLDRAFT_734857 [Exidia glandulosa HHB12029]